MDEVPTVKYIYQKTINTSLLLKSNQFNSRERL